jgi:hypothetical protein
MIYTILYTALFLWVFWYLYLIVMGLYRAKLMGTLTWPVKILGAPALLIGIIVDVVAQYTIATVIFREWPRRGEHLVTDRLQRYMANPSGSRYLKAKWLCEHLLDPFDPTGKHC